MWHSLSKMCAWSPMYIDAEVVLAAFDVFDHLPLVSLPCFFVFMCFCPSDCCHAPRIHPAFRSILGIASGRRRCRWWNGGWWTRSSCFPSCLSSTLWSSGLTKDFAAVVVLCISIFGTTVLLSGVNGWLWWFWLLGGGVKSRLDFFFCVFLSSLSLAGTGSGLLFSSRPSCWFVSLDPMVETVLCFLLSVRGARLTI